MESFVLGENEFDSFWQKVRTDKVKFGDFVDQDFSFKSPFIKASFDFAFLILDLLGKVNTTFQQRFCTVSDLWDVIISLKSRIYTMAQQIACNSLFELDCLFLLSHEERKQFQTVLVELLQFLDKRFPCLSSSVDMKKKSSSVVHTAHQTTTPPSNLQSVPFSLFSISPPFHIM